MEIRRLGPEDAEAFSVVRLEALQKDPDAFGATYEDEKKRTLEEWKERLSQTSPGESGYFGAFSDGEIVGTIGFFRHKGTKARHKVAIVSMYVRESHRGSGLAAGLMNAAIDYLRGLGDVDQVQLAVVTTNPAAVRFYEKIGFATYGFEKRALRVGDQYFDEALMYLLFE
ncbi:GNAT family N-acetyltransferase [Brevibacillus choshinensis]|uniref:GNAT family N-acetyltransferase n=1 Tax=Brevibacillus choshinensis TaxID=54911 RepID=UPI002E23949C|nr:GNAT family N-acetyltransferase [Brevibacillus choshinensis]MED4750999.1 GNAT family N-acetyltransferase [Brevibacillus choshinensis]MED4783129.1 GNAT family N-acetyltransferase [Brevibacillus choshinensis]